jgi:hypothetical protein
LGILLPVPVSAFRGSFPKTTIETVRLIDCQPMTFSLLSDKNQRGAARDVVPVKCARVPDHLGPGVAGQHGPQLANQLHLT